MMMTTVSDGWYEQAKSKSCLNIDEKLFSVVAGTPTFAVYIKRKGGFKFRIWWYQQNERVMHAEFIKLWENFVNLSEI